MNRRNLALLLIALMMIGGTAFFINGLRANQKLTKPGIIAKVIPGSQRMELYLPERVLDYDSAIVPTDKEVLRGLPQDTSFVQRRYFRAGDMAPFWMNIVLMGTDRTSIHKPQFCLRGQGWDIDGGASSFDTVRVEGPHPYDLPIMKIMNSRDVVDRDGKQFKIRGIYVYWFVADNDLTADHKERMWKMAKRLLKTGELERWAYVSMLGVCLPGQEEATYARMKQFIATAVPKFQPEPKMAIAETATAQTASR